MANLIFYVMAAGAVLFAAGVVLLRTPIASVISLLGSFFCLATIYLVAGFPFLAAVQILVYAGAILVLFLFVIMLLNMTEATALPRLDRSLLTHRRLGLSAAVSLVLLGVGLFAANATDLPAGDPALAGHAIDSIDGLAAAMFTTYLLPFEATSLLLLATAVAVLVLAKRQRPTGHGTAPAHAVARAPGDGTDGGVLTPATPRPASSHGPKVPEEELVSTGGRE